MVQKNGNRPACFQGPRYTPKAPWSIIKAGRPAKLFFLTQIEAACQIRLPRSDNQGNKHMQMGQLLPIGRIW